MSCGPGADERSMFNVLSSHVQRSLVQVVSHTEVEEAFGKQRLFHTVGPVMEKEHWSNLVEDHGSCC